MFRLTIATLWTAAALSSASAQNLGWMNPDNLQLLGRLGNVAAAARHCNWTVGEEAFKSEMTRSFGPDLTSAKAADLMLTVLGFSAMADELIFDNRKQRASKCAELMKLFGRNGSVTPGLLIDARQK